MSTHNIGFYEDLTKIIFELSSNIIKYAPYFFCCYPKHREEEESIAEKSAISSPTDLIYPLKLTF